MLSDPIFRTVVEYERNRLGRMGYQCDISIYDQKEIPYDLGNDVMVCYIETPAATCNGLFGVGKDTPDNIHLAVKLLAVLRRYAVSPGVSNVQIAPPAIRIHPYVQV